MATLLYLIVDLFFLLVCLTCKIPFSVSPSDPLLFKAIRCILILVQRPLFMLSLILFLSIFTVLTLDSAVSFWDDALGPPFRLCCSVPFPKVTLYCITSRRSGSGAGVAP